MSNTSDVNSPPSAAAGRMANLEQQQQKVEDAPDAPNPNDPQEPERFRTVADCATGELLREALLACSTADADWKTPHIDASTSLPQSLDDEARRLLELKEYYVLDSEQEAKFERITGLASRIFDVPIALISLVDIGRQWFLSNRGLGEVRETSRKVSFCAHAIVSKADIFVVPDTFEDSRFRENGLVTGQPLIRFYAGVPLVTPTGAKLGTLCIIDRTPRPKGLDLKDKQNLTELAEMAMETLNDRKQDFERIHDEKNRLIACCAHDLLSPLTGIQLNLGLLMEDESLQRKMDHRQRELMETTVQCSTIIERICIQAIESFRGGLVRDTASSDEEHSEDGSVEEGRVDIDQLVAGIERVVSTFPKKVPVFVEKDENVPKTIIKSDEVKLFRSVLNYLTNACKHTVNGSIHLKIYVRKATDSVMAKEGTSALPSSLFLPCRDVLCFEVHDCGPGISLQEYPNLFTPTTPTNQGHVGSRMSNSGIGLYSVATEIGSLGGDYGVFPRQDLVDLSTIENDLNDDPCISGCVFWFSVPLFVEASPLSGSAPGASREAVPTIAPRKRSSNALAQEVEGMSISNRCTKKQAVHRDDIEVEIKEDESTISKSMEDEEPENRPRRVLIVDDSLTIRKGLTRGFERLGFTVDEAENGLQGFKMMKSRLYDICIIDFLMPILDGPDAVRRLRAWEQDHRPEFCQYVIGISAHANGKDAQVGLKSGMNRFMGKPVPLKSLSDIAKCKEVTDASTQLDLIYSRSRQEFVDAARASEISRLHNEDVHSLRSSMTSLSSNSNNAKKTCLIVEQDADACRSLKRLAKAHGYSVVSVTTAEDGIRLLKLRMWLVCFIDNNPNLIVTFRDWEHKTRSIKQGNVYVISDTSHPLNGFDGLLSKPVSAAKASQILEDCEVGKSETTFNIVSVPTR